MDTTIGTRIKSRRKELKISGIQIKEQTGISTGNLSDIENGKSLPSAIAIIQLAQILNCSTDFILLGKTLNSESLCNSDVRESRLITCFREMELSDQEELLMIAEIKLNKGKKAKNIKSSHSELENKTSDIA